MNTARYAGLFWLITFVAGMLAMAVYNATAADILRNESLFRGGVAANILATIAYIAATLFVYELLKRVNRRLSLLAAMFSLTACALSGCSFVFQLTPLHILRGAFTKQFSADQVDAVTGMLLRLAQQASAIAFVFFGLHVLLVGALILKSSYISRVVGVLMAFGGLGWLTFAFANLMSPSLGRLLSPDILFPGILGEGSFIVWLLLFGGKVPRWSEVEASAS